MSKIATLPVAADPVQAIAKAVAEGRGLPVKEALAQAGLQPSNPARWRWVNLGIRGRDGRFHKLPTVIVGRQRFTCSEAVASWIEQLNTGK
jgi:hypothetical protein